MAGLVCWALRGWAPILLLVAIPVGILATGLFQTLSYVPVRRQRYGPAAVSKVVQSGGFAAAGAGLGLLQGPSIGLVVAGIFGRFAGAVSLLRTVQLKVIPLRRVWAVAVKHRAYPMFSAPGALLNVSGLIITPVLFYTAFGASWAGQLGLMERAAAAPIGMIGAAVSQVYAGRLAGLIRSRDSEAFTIFWKLTGAMFLMGLVPALVLAAVGEWAIPMIFGSSWTEAGMIAELMAPLLLASFVVAPVNSTLVVAGCQRTQLAWEAGRLSMMVLVWAAVFHYRLEPLAAFGLYVGAACFAYAVFLGLCAISLRRLNHSRQEGSA